MINSKPFFNKPYGVLSGLINLFSKVQDIICLLAHQSLILHARVSMIDIISAFNDLPDQKDMTFKEVNNGKNNNTIRIRFVTIHSVCDVWSTPFRYRKGTSTVFGRYQYRHLKHYEK